VCFSPLRQLEVAPQKVAHLGGEGLGLEVLLGLALHVLRGLARGPGAGQGLGSSLPVFPPAKRGLSCRALCVGRRAQGRIGYLAAPLLTSRLALVRSLPLTRLRPRLLGLRLSRLGGLGLSRLRGSL